MSELASQVVVIVGGTKGIGEAIARDASRQGARVVIAGRNTDAASALVQSIVDEGGIALAVRCDVNDQRECDELFSAANETFGRVDTVFANQGVGGPAKPMIDWSAHDIAACINVNLLGCLNVARAAHQHLAADGGGRLIITGSGTGHSANFGSGMYGISKAAASHLVRQLSLEWRRDCIAVNELIPGPVRTEMTGFTEESKSQQGKRFEEFAVKSKEWLKDPDEVTPLARLLAEFPTNGPSGQVFCLNGRLL